MNDVDWGVRAAAWELAAFSFRYPGAELEGAVASGEWAAAAREIAGALGLALPEGLGEGLSGRSGIDGHLLFGHGLHPRCLPNKQGIGLGSDGLRIGWRRQEVRGLLFPDCRKLS